MQINSETVNELFEYHSDGILIWKRRPTSHFQTIAGCNGFNSRYQGKEVGTTVRHPRSGKEYKIVKFCGVHYRIHAIVWLIHNKKWPAKTIDHINGDSFDNRIENLREVAQSENLKNKRKYKTNKTGQCGVWFDKKRNRYHSYITVNGKRKHIGVHSDFESAKRARLEKEVEFNFHKNHGKELD